MKKIKNGAVVEGSNGTGTVEGVRRVEGRRLAIVTWHDGEERTVEPVSCLELVASEAP